ncbi:Ca2+ regulator and membrane fusion protein Fig1-domain-containing protein [Podospora didyma]|uniref:Ca2+ regulator and membrane fusion protein Fig1-domain-containing protein n=1 Tax=Podospora didyma TaxID=330526 RepID=A0AAE0N308_9PEZI|nr:Ca2+ regulator and membrane fusion protein Fig1-domain-containing protein [Podospora didyma]
MDSASWKNNPSFAYGVVRRIASLYRPVQLMSCAIIVMQCLLLAGCASSNFLVNIYLFSFALTATETEATTGFSRLEIRVGHFFLCAKADEGIDWICGDADRVNGHMIGVVEPWNIRKTAYDLRDGAISPSMNIILLASNLLTLFLVSSFPILRLPDKANSSAPQWLTRSLAINPIFGMASSLIAALWQHTAAATSAPLMSYLSAGAVTGAVGPAAATVAWLSFGLSLVTGALCLRAVNAMVHRQLEDEDVYTAASTLSTFATVTSESSEDDEVESRHGGGSEEIEMSSLRADN